jgi:hypothetical protein
MEWTISGEYEHPNSKKMYPYVVTIVMTDKQSIIWNALIRHPDGTFDRLPGGSITPEPFSKTSDVSVIEGWVHQRVKLQVDAGVTRI